MTWTSSWTGSTLVKVHSGQGSSVGGATVEELEGVKEWAVLLFPTMAVNFIFSVSDPHSIHTDPYPVRAQNHNADPDPNTNRMRIWIQASR